MAISRGLCPRFVIGFSKAPCHTCCPVPSFWFCTFVFWHSMHSIACKAIVYIYIYIYIYVAPCCVVVVFSRGTTAVCSGPTTLSLCASQGRCAS